MKRLFLAFLGLVVVLLAILIGRAATLPSLQPGPEEPVTLTVDAEGLAHRFARAITFPTISNQDRTDIDAEAFLGLHEHFATAYPLVHSVLDLETVNEYSLLYTWRGTHTDLGFS